MDWMDLVNAWIGGGVGYGVVLFIYDCLLERGKPIEEAADG